MCGIFGFRLNKPIPLEKVSRLLEKLELHQYAREPNPVGGYGAGMVVLNHEGSFLMEKTGKTEYASPVKELAKLIRASEAQVLMGHVRMPSPQFMGTARFRETAQPYLASCHKGVSIVSAHNGYIENYEKLRKELGMSHALESETIGLVDSEVIPHCFEEILNANADMDEAVQALQNMLEGHMTISLLQTGRQGAFLHLIHKGKTRGLTVWTNTAGEFVFCSRKEPLQSEFGTVLAEGKFKEAISVAWQEEKSIKLSFPLNS